MEKWKKKLLDAPTAPLWKRVGIYPHHGVNIFLPALHSEKSCGIGEFLDLIPIIDWCHQLKMDVIQLLPLNNADHDPSPYNPISSCAINFLFLSLHALPYIEKLPSLKNSLKTFSPLNQHPRIMYEDVIVYKMNWLNTYFEAVGKTIMKSEAFQNFLHENTWLEAFALFRTLKDLLGNTPWMSWPEDIKAPSQKKYRELIKTHASKISFYITMQFLCYVQLMQVKNHAQTKKILLKGDIPILVSYESADAWHYPSYFNMQLVAGAPPDMYYEQGQYWGFPIFQWDAMRQDHFLWWGQRLKFAAHFFDLFRIDHVIGLFRIWAIPLHGSANEGIYIPETASQWEAQGRELLEMILSNAKGMLPIAEDLGTIPDILPICLKELAICGTKVMRWEKECDSGHFIPFTDYDPISLTCVSTHDSPTLAQWWRDYPEEARIFALFKQWQYSPDLKFDQRYTILWESHHTPSLFHINLLQEYLALFPELVWPHLDKERINVPGSVQPNNWTFRYRPCVEDIITHKELNQQMKNILFSPSPLQKS